MTTFKKNSCYSCPAVYVCLDVDSDNDFDNIPGMVAIAKTLTSDIGSRGRRPDASDFRSSKVPFIDESSAVNVGTKIIKITLDLETQINPAAQSVCTADMDDTMVQRVHGTRGFLEFNTNCWQFRLSICPRPSSLPRFH